MGGIGVFELALVAVAVALLVVWAWALIDCALHEPPTVDKLVWVLIVLWLNLFGAIAYLAIRRPRRRAASHPQPAA
jgi:hypothetical protein